MSHPSALYPAVSDWIHSPPKPFSFSSRFLLAPVEYDNTFASDTSSRVSVCDCDECGNLHGFDWIVGIPQ